MTDKHSAAPGAGASGPRETPKVYELLNAALEASGLYMTEAAYSRAIDAMLAVDSCEHKPDRGEAGPPAQDRLSTLLAFTDGVMVTFRNYYHAAISRSHVEDKIEEWLQLRQQITACASAPRGPEARDEDDPPEERYCTCGHLRGRHAFAGVGRCLQCDCQEFNARSDSTASRGTAPAVPEEVLEPAGVEMARLCDACGHPAEWHPYDEWSDKGSRVRCRESSSCGCQGYRFNYTKALQSRNEALKRERDSLREHLTAAQQALCTAFSDAPTAMTAIMDRGRRFAELEARASGVPEASGGDALQRHTDAVGRFLNDLYAVMIDPLAEGEMSVDALCRQLLEQAKKDRETLSGGAAAVLRDHWQPIETAPKDGTAILTYNPTRRHGQYVIRQWCGGPNWSCQCCPESEPTHWKPLDPPARSAAPLPRTTAEKPSCAS